MIYNTYLCGPVRRVLEISVKTRTAIVDQDSGIHYYKVAQCTCHSRWVAHAGYRCCVPNSCVAGRRVRPSAVREPAGASSHRTQTISSHTGTPRISNVSAFRNSTTQEITANAFTEERYVCGAVRRRAQLLGPCVICVHVLRHLTICPIWSKRRTCKIGSDTAIYHLLRMASTDYDGGRRVGTNEGISGDLGCDFPCPHMFRYFYYLLHTILKCDWICLLYLLLFFNI